MGIVSRVLDRERVSSMGQYKGMGGGDGIEAARRVGAKTIRELIGDSGLRGRGGAGFPTGLKWNTVAAARSAVEPTTVVVNAAEGEPGTFKDRALLRANPYRLLEGAVIAALAVDAETIRIGIKATFGREIQRLGRAMDEAAAEGWFEGLDVGLVLGPSSYLFGEETALLEVVEGRQPFPRIAPPFRRGVDEDDGTRSAAGMDLAAPGGSSEAPALVNNVETLANVPLIVMNGVKWFREFGTEESPGTIVCTISGATRREGVAELELGTTLREAIDLIGWGPAERRRLGNVLSGTANPLLPPELLDTPLTYEAMSAVGAGLGSAGFIVFDDATDPVAIARGVSHFLAVESCGQCEHCKQDGLEIATLLGEVQASTITEPRLAELERRVNTVAIGARCNLARQQEEVVGSLMRLYDEVIVSHVVSGSSAAAPASRDTIPIVPIDAIAGGVAILETDQLTKQPDWSYDEVDSGTTPAELLASTPVHITTAGRTRRFSSFRPATTDGQVHAMELIDEAHELLDGLLLDALGADPSLRPAAIGKLAHIIRVHIDVTRRILHPMASRYGEENAEALIERAEERNDLITALVYLLDDVDQSDRECDATLRALGEELKQHCGDEERMVGLMEASMTPDDHLLLIEGLMAARSSSQVA